MTLGLPRLHYRLTDSTSERARGLAGRGAPHGTLVTAEEQTAGRGRQGRSWIAPAGRALLCSVVVREPSRLLSLAAGVAVAETVGPRAELKWPNDVLLDGRKVAGILVEGRPQEGWAVVGIGINVALEPGDFPEELCGAVGGLGGSTSDVEPTLARLLEALEDWLARGPEEVVGAWRERDALYGKRIRWASGAGRAGGVDEEGRLIVEGEDGQVRLDAGEVHLLRD